MMDDSFEVGIPNLNQIFKGVYDQKGKQFWKAKSSINTLTTMCHYPWKEEINDGHATTPEP